MSKLFGKIEQLGMVVKSAQQTMEDWVRLGVGPFYVFREVPADDFRYKGEVSEAPILTLAFAQSGDMQIEIIQQHNDVSSAYRDFLDAGYEGVQHVSSWQADTEDYDEKYRAIVDAGFDVAHEGTTVGGLVRFAYFSSPLPGGMSIEISEARMPELVPLMELVANAAENWDGNDPIREFPSS